MLIELKRIHSKIAVLWHHIKWFYEVDKNEEILLFGLDIHEYFDQNIKQNIQYLFEYNIEDNRLKKKEVEQLFKFIFKNTNFIVKKMYMILNERPYVVLFGRLKIV